MTWVIDRRTNSKAAGGGMTPTVPVPMDRPAPTLTGKAGGQWVFRQDGRTAKLTPRGAMVLQTFPVDFPVQGTQTKQFEQIGNAVPPLLAAHVLAALTGRTLEAA